jgi:hypothetical protein
MHMAQQHKSYSIDDDATSTGLEDLESESDEAKEQDQEQQPVEAAPHRPPPKSPKRQSKSPNSTAARATQPRKWPEDPEEMWPAILKELPGWGRDPSEVRIQVWIIRGVGVHKPRKLEPKIYGDTVLGDEPGQMLMDRIIDEYHVRTRGTSQMPTSYQLRFVLSDGGWIGQSGIFDLDPFEQLERARAARGGFTPQGYGYPPPPPPPAAAYGRQAYYPPQPPPDPRRTAPVASESVEIARLRDENIFLRGQLDRLSEQIASIREGRSFDPPPPAAATSSPSPMSASDIAAAVIASLQAAGLVPPAKTSAPTATGAGAPAPAAPTAASSQIEQMANKMFGTFMEHVMKRMVGTMQQSFEQPTVDVATVAVDPPKQDDDEDLPFKAKEIPGAKWPDGRPVIYPRNKETGKLDLTGAIMANPYIAEKGMELASSVVDVGKDVLRRIAADGQPHIVSRIPTGALDGTPTPWQRQPI